MKRQPPPAQGQRARCRHRAIDGYQQAVPEHWAFDGVEFPAAGITGGEATPIIGGEAGT